MDIKRFQIGERMSKGVCHNGTLYLAGCVASPDKTTIQEQTQDILNRIESLLLEFGSNKMHILSATIYMKDISMVAGMNQVWDEWVKTATPPARTCVEAKMNSESLLVEITVIAAQQV